MDRIPVLVALAVEGSKADDDGKFVRLWFRADAGEFILVLPTHLASLTQVALEDGISDAQRNAGERNRFQVVENSMREPSPIPGRDLLHLRLEGGMELTFLLPESAATPRDSQRPA